MGAVSPTDEKHGPRAHLLLGTGRTVRVAVKGVKQPLDLAPGDGHDRGSKRHTTHHGLFNSKATDRRHTNLTESGLQSGCWQAWPGSHAKDKVTVYGLFAEVVAGVCGCTAVALWLAFSQGWWWVVVPELVQQWIVPKRIWMRKLHSV